MIMRGDPMSKYVPDRWVLMEIPGSTGPTYHVFCGWVGGYLDGDTWRRSTAIESIVLDEFENRVAKTASGSEYVINETAIGFTGFMMNVLSPHLEKNAFKIHDDLSKTDEILSAFAAVT